MGIFTFFKRKSKTTNKLQTEMIFPVFCKVHAVKSPDHQGAIVQSRVGDKLQIVHTPTTERPFCVSIYSLTLNRVLGFVEDKLAKKLTDVFGQNFCRDGEVEQITGGPPYKYYGCNIRIMNAQDFIEELSKNS